MSFDFAGIGYLRPAEEQRLRDALQQRHQAAERSERAQSSPAFASPVANETGTIGAKGPVVVPPERKQFVADIWRVILVVVVVARWCRQRRFVVSMCDL